MIIYGKDKSVICCDIPLCFHKATLPYSSHRACFDAALLKGWAVGLKIAYCPTCNEARLNELTDDVLRLMYELYTMKKYQTIIADPPWKYGKWGKASDTPLARKKYPNGQWEQCFNLPYPAMTVQEIARLSVGNLAADDCDLYLWTTQKYLPDAFSVMQTWDFRYCQTLTWCKAPKGIGQGGLFCPTTEFLLLGRKGRMPKGKRRLDSTWWQVTRTSRHSQKPVFFHEIIETVSDAPRLEMFSRQNRNGWDAWGNEVESDESITKALTGQAG